jgi:hypothetical protein
MQSQAKRQTAAETSALVPRYLRGRAVRPAPQRQTRGATGSGNKDPRMPGLPYTAPAGPCGTSRDTSAGEMRKARSAFKITATSITS